MLGPVEAHGVHRLQNLQQSPGDDLVIAAGVGDNFSGGGNILVDQEFWWISSYLKRGTSINSEYMFFFVTSIQSSLSSVPSTCGSVLERGVNCQLHSLRTIFLSIPYKQGVTLPNNCSCQTQRSHSWFVYSRQPPEPQNKSKNINRLRRVNHQKELD